MVDMFPLTTTSIISTRAMWKRFAYLIEQNKLNWNALIYKWVHFTVEKWIKTLILQSFWYIMDRDKDLIIEI